MSRKLLLSLAGSLGLASLAFLLVFITAYQLRLSEERSRASSQLNQLLHVALENAMLKRDLAGLQEIVARLGRQPGIVDVAIADPDLLIRFASAPGRLNTRLSGGDVGCEGCSTESITMRAEHTMSVRAPGRPALLRSIKPIPNKPECRECHGAVQQHPVNGLLVVDRDAGNIELEAGLAAALLSGAGLTVVLIGLASHWLFLRRLVIAPIAALDTASNAIAGGDLSRRVPLVPGRNDEMHDLAASFNSMAIKLERSMREISEHELFLRELVDAVPDGLRVLDENMQVVVANASLARQAGATVDQLMQQPCYALHGRTTPCPPTLVTCPYHALPESGEPIRYVHRHVRKDGSEVHVETTAARITVVREGARRQLIVEAVRDLEQQIKYSHEQRLAEIGQLAAGVAHEIYNPLASVAIALESILRSDILHGIDPEAADYISAVEAELNKCIAVAKRLLDLSQVPSGDVQLVSVSVIVPEVASLLIYEAGQRRVSLACDMADGLRVLATDPEVRMVALNLMQNAFHAMPDGGILKVTGRRDGASVVLTFQDSGVGIEPERLRQIFDPFHSRRADGVSGTGLGLTISQAIVRRYHGDITVESEPGVGSTFRVVLPSADAGIKAS